MRQVVVKEHLDELEVHPSGLYQRWAEVCALSAKELLEIKDQFIKINCPACHSRDYELAFVKQGYQYWVCGQCATLYISPRPSDPLMRQYIQSSQAAEFRKSETYLQEMADRFDDLAKYRAGWILDLCKRIAPNAERAIVDVETRLPQALNALKSSQPRPILSVNPVMPVNDYRQVEHLQALVGSDASILTAFDILEHQARPGNFLRTAYQVLGKDGLLVLTTRSGSGFDIQVLWENCPTIFPVEHLTLYSVEGLRSLLKNIGFEIVEFSTPGQLDVQMIERTMSENPDADLPRFLKYFISFRNEYAKHRLQQFLQENLFSSHLRVVAKKKTR